MTRIPTVKRLIIALACSFCCVTSEAVTLSGKVVDFDDNSIAVKGALVSFEHTLYRTTTDSAGRFSLDIPENSIERVKHTYAPPPLNIHINRKLGFITLPKAGILSRISIFSLDGRVVLSTPVDGSATHVPIPLFSTGVFILSLTLHNGVKVASPLLCTPAQTTMTARFVMPAQPVNLRAQADMFPLIFRHDAFYPLDREIPLTNDTLLIHMKSDPRAAFFDETKLHSMHLTISREDSLLMERNAQLEEYQPAELKYNDAAIGKVGVRYKGSEYSIPRCFDKDGNRSSYADCRNVSLKIKFDKYNDTTRFFEMKKLNLHSMSYDGSKMREMLAYGLFRDMGVYTCRTVFVKVYVNNVFRGLFTGVEEVDGRFTKSRWPQFGDGNLYKEAWPNSLNKAYIKTKLETNNDPEDSVPPIRLADMTKTIRASTPGTFLSDIKPYMNIDYFLDYIVVDRAIHNADGIMTWYYEKNWQGNHNFYLYEEENAGGKAWLIPWDLNATITPTDPIIDDYDVPEWNVVPDTCGPLLGWGDSQVLPPNCDKLIGLTAATSFGQFKKAGEFFLKEIFTTDRMHARLDNLAKVIAPVMDDEPTISKSGWEDEIRSIHTILDRLHTGFKEYLDGRIVLIDTSSFFAASSPDSGFNITPCNNFEFSGNPSITDWAGASVSANSTISLSFDSLSPLYGKGGLTASFTINTADSTETYAEWSYVGLFFDTAQDLSEIDSLKICLLGDIPRNCRIVFESDVYKRHDIHPYERYGWETILTRKSKQFCLPLRQAAYPEWADPENPDIKDSVIASVNGIGIIVLPQFDTNGKLRFVPDSGFVKIDNVEFVPKRQ